MPHLPTFLKLRSWSNRLSPNFNPFVSCNEHKECMNIDMNSICSTKTQKCECREDMRWNNETLECQVILKQPSISPNRTFKAFI